VVFDADMCANRDFFLKILEVLLDDSVALCLTPQVCGVTGGQVWGVYCCSWHRAWWKGSGDQRGGWGWEVFKGAQRVATRRLACSCWLLPWPGAGGSGSHDPRSASTTSTPTATSSTTSTSSSGSMFCQAATPGATSPAQVRAAAAPQPPRSPSAGAPTAPFVATPGHAPAMDPAPSPSTTPLVPPSHPPWRPLAGTNFCIRARALGICGWFPEYTITEDYALSMELKKRGFVWVPPPPPAAAGGPGYACRVVCRHAGVRAASQRRRRAFGVARHAQPAGLVPLLPDWRACTPCWWPAGAGTCAITWR
jgi:hypothetical protein